NPCRFAWQVNRSGGYPTGATNRPLPPDLAVGTASAAGPTTTGSSNPGRKGRPGKEGNLEGGGGSSRRRPAPPPPGQFSSVPRKPPPFPPFAPSRPPRRFLHNPVPRYYPKLTATSRGT